MVRMVPDPGWSSRIRCGRTHPTFEERIPMTVTRFAVIAAGLVAFAASTVHAQAWQPTQYQDAYINHGYFSGTTGILDVGSDCVLLRSGNTRFYIYRLQQDETWAREAEILPIQPGSNFGFRGSIDGDVAVITAPDWVDDEGVERGRAYAYERDPKTSTWSLVHAFDPLEIDEQEAGIAGFNFGSSVSLEGDLVAISDSRAMSDLGYVRFFVRNGPGSWEPSDSYYGLAEGDRFGTSIDIHQGAEGVCAIGSSQLNVPDETGTIEFFVRDASLGWLPQPGLLEGPGEFGWPSDIDIHGGRMAVSATNQYGLPGIVEIWEGGIDDWSRRTTLIGGGEGKGGFGTRVQLWNTKLLVTQWFTMGLPSDGAALLYERNLEGEWRQDRRFNGALDFPSNAGCTAGMVGDHVLVCATGNGVYDHKREVFDHPPDEPTSPCQADVNGDGVVDAGDLGLLIAAWGMCP